MTTPYKYDLATCADEVDSAAWKLVCDPEDNPYLDLRFLRAVESSFVRDTKMWYAIFRNDAGLPVACTCFSSYLVDGTLTTPPFFQNLIAIFRRRLPNLLKFRMLLCGIPVSTCGNLLAITERADMDRLIPALDEVANKLGRIARSHLISFKEFDPGQAARMSALEGCDYQSARSLIAYSLPGEFKSFDDYLSKRSKRTRATIRRSLKKFDAAGYACEQLRGGDGVDQLFTDEVHGLYLNVLNKAKLKFEKLPVDFFREVARRLPDESRFTIVRKEGRIVGFCCAVAARESHSMLYCGLDYTLNPEADLYFNIIYRGMSQGMRPGVRMIHIGGAADEFKRRLGCTGEPLSIYVKAVGTVYQFLFKKVFWMLFDTTKTPVLPNTELEPALMDEGENERIAA